MHTGSGIRKGMEVIGSCGNHLGVVDAFEDKSIQLMRKEGDCGGIHHFIPLDWVTSVDQTVQLDRTCEDARKQWHLEPFATSM